MFTVILKPGDPLPAGRVVDSWKLTDGSLYLIVER